MPAPFFFRQRAHLAFTEMQRFDAGVARLARLRDRIIDNVFELIRDHQEGHYYGNLFEEIIAILTPLPTPPQQKLRFTDLLTKLSPAYVNPSSLGGWLGGASELLDAVRALSRPGAAPTRLAIPSGYKEFSRIDYQHPRGNRPKQDSQDIDRTEVIGTTKYYVEVKANSQTAVDKINSKGVNQLEGILAVIRCRVRRQLAGETKSANRNGYQLAPALSITNPQHWLILFTTAKVHVYYTRQFHLIIDQQIITPVQLAQMYADLWTHLNLPSVPVGPYQIKTVTGAIATLNAFYLANHTIFPSPSAAAAMGFNLGAWYQRLNPAPPPPAPPRPPP